MKRTTTLLLSLIATPLLALDPPAMVGKFAAGEKYAEPLRDAPPSVSRMFVRAVKGGEDVDSVDLPATGGGMIIMLVPVGKARMRHASAMLKTPAGDELRSSEWNTADRGVQRFVIDAASELGIDLDAGATQEVIHVDRTDAASYRLQVASMSAGSGMLVVAAEPESKLTMTTSAGPLSRHEGEPVTLRATLRDGDEPLTGITVLARLAVPGAPAGEPIPLVDDGRHDDGEANDGEYAATLNALPSNSGGFVAVRFDADGTNRRGAVFARSGSSSFMNERTSARLEPNVRATVTEGVLHVRANVDVVAAGSYRFDVLVASRADAKGERQGIAWGQAVRMLTTGANELSLDVPVDDAKAGDLFLDVRLLSLDSMGVAGRVTREGVE
ncbi:MAG TPA: choice-of-anchor X domain-containing protein [Thermoanaerobaculia bacterium]|nr:choice-of-anchor X domain-containing protein [Thermoanaerobaculia bacterium]